MKLFLQRHVSWIFACIICFYLLHIFWSQKIIYTTPFDPSYWKERFETSQWVLPLSQRIIGDDGLYLAEAYRLIRGGDPSLYNVETTPLGKYLIGVSIEIFANENIYGFLITLCLIAAVWYLAKLYTKSVAIAWMAAALVAVDPLITQQFTLPMLDSLQSLFLVLHLVGLCLLIMKRRHPYWIVVGSGIALGLFAGSKPPLLAPIIAITGLVTVLYTHKRVLVAMIYLMSACMTYLLLYVPYFFYGHSFLDWMKLQKWIISFYLASKLPPNIGSVITTLLFNQTKDLFSDAWHMSNEWSITWPIITVLAVLLSIRRRNLTHNKLWIPLMGTAALLVAIFFITPFWTRYLILVLPLLYIVVTNFINQILPQRAATAVVIVGIGINCFFSLSLLYPTATKEFNQFTYDWEHGFFRDMYERFTDQSKARFQKSSIQKQGLAYFYDAQIEALDVRYDASQTQKRFGTIALPVEIAYRTRNLGEFIEHTTITLIHENNRWRVSWDWDNMMSGLTDESVIRSTIVPARRGTLYTGTMVIKDVESDLVSITPDKVDAHTEREMLLLLEKLFQKKLFALSIHQRYIGNTLPHVPRPIGVFPTPISQEDRARLLSYRGVTLAPAYTRESLLSLGEQAGSMSNTLFIECCSLLYSTTTYDGASGFEKTYNTTLKGEYGGTITIYDNNGNLVRTVLSKVKRDGADVAVPAVQ